MNRLSLLVICLLPHVLLAFGPPVNDNFADAIVISNAPFSHDVATIDASQATIELGEEICVADFAYWYTFTPATTGTYRLASEITGEFEFATTNDIFLGVYLGDDLATLVLDECSDEDNGFGGGEVLFLELNGGQRYNFRVALGGVNNSDDVITTSLELLESINWTGDVSDNWNDPDNWDLDRVPTANDQVFIDASAANECSIHTVSGTPTNAIARSVKLSNQALTIGTENSLSIAQGIDGIWLPGGVATLDLLGTLNITEMTGDGILVQEGSTITVESTGILNISNVDDDGLQVTGIGSTLNYSSTLSIIDNIKDNGFVLSIDANATIDANAELFVINCLDNAGAVLSGSTLTLNGTFTGTNSADDGFSTSGGQLTVGENGLLLLEGSGNLGIIDADFINNGTIRIINTLDGDAIDTDEDCINNGSIFINGATDDGIDVEDGKLFTNNGYIEVRNTSSSSIEDGNFTNANGSTLVTSNRMTSDFNFAEGSRLVLGPGATCITFPNPISLDGVTLELQIDGTQGCSNYDQIIVFETLEFNGTILELTGDYQPQIDETFTIVSGGTEQPVGNFVGLPEGSTLAFNNTEMTITYQGGNDGRDIVLTATALLPLNLLSFTGETAGKQNRLTWTTANEEDFSHFSVERSVTGTDWLEIGTVGGDQSGFYQFEEEATTANYRLKMVDLDGTFGYSEVVFLENNLGAAAGAMLVYPNPSTGQFTVDVSQLPRSVGRAGKLTISDLNGRMIWSTTLAPEQREVQVALDAPKTGLYILSYAGANGVATHVLSVQ